MSPLCVFPSLFTLLTSLIRPLIVTCTSTVCRTGVLLRRAQQAILASDLAKNSESFSPGADIQNHSADNELTTADRIQAESHFSNEVGVHSEMYNTFGWRLYVQSPASCVGVGHFIVVMPNPLGCFTV